MTREAKKINIGDLVYIKSSITGEIMSDMGIGIVLSKSIGLPKDIVREKREICSVLWQGDIETHVDIEWLEIAT